MTKKYKAISDSGHSHIEWGCTFVCFYTCKESRWMHVERYYTVCNQWVCWIYGVVSLRDNAVFDRFMCLTWEPTAMLIIFEQQHSI